MLVFHVFEVRGFGAFKPRYRLMSNQIELFVSEGGNCVE
jgi:hypothetical protein